jgi:hypothetical protein
MSGPQANIPQHDSLFDSIPSLGKPVPTGTMTRGHLDATDPNIPKVQPSMPSWLGDTIKTPTAEPAYAQPSFQPGQYPAQQEPVPQFNAPYPQAPAYQQPQAQPTSFTPNVVPQAQYARPASSIPAPQPGRTQGSVQMPNAPVQHPVVDALLADLGFTDQNLVVKTIAGHNFTMRKLPAELFAFALSIVSKVSTTNDEYAMRLNLTLGALSVVKIDDQPVWHLAKVDVSKVGQFSDTNPPFSVASKSGSFIIDLFFSKLDFDVIGKIADAYDDAWGTKDADADLLAQAGAIKADDQRVRFKCSVEGCGHVEDVIPEYTDAQGSMQPRFCPTHGPSMTPIGYLNQLANIPLA